VKFVRFPDPRLAVWTRMAESIDALPDAGARENLDHEGVRGVFVTDTVRAAGEGWPTNRSNRNGGDLLRGHPEANRPWPWV
jgi:hypothetical protein